MIAQAWRANWEYIIPFLSLPDALRQAVYTTNTIEACTARSARRSRPAATSPTNKPRPS